MTGSANNTGKILGASTTVSGSSALLAHSGYKELAEILIIVAVIGVLLVIFSSTIKPTYS